MIKVYKADLQKAIGQCLAEEDRYKSMVVLAEWIQKKLRADHEAEIDKLKKQLERCKVQRDIALAGWYSDTDFRNAELVEKKKSQFDEELSGVE